jgi:hypothetical protein
MKSDIRNEGSGSISQRGEMRDFDDMIGENAEFGGLHQVPRSQALSLLLLHRGIRGGRNERYTASTAGI